MTRDQIIAANPLARYLMNRGYDLRQSGKNFVTNACPVAQHKKYHRPDTIDTDKNLWHCNDCNVGGTVVDWVMRERGCTAGDAFQILGGGRNGHRERTRLRPIRQTTARTASHDQDVRLY